MFPAARTPLLRFAAYLLIVALCVAHLHQVILLSGLERIPGDLGDSRFNNLVLEHLWRAAHGEAPWASPPMFYPVENVLFMSDTHFGTFPFYAAFRAAGADMETSLQGWALTLAALNAAALLWVFHRLRLPLWTSACLTFFGCAHFAFAGKLGHLQMLPTFPVVVAFYCLLQTATTGRARWLAGLLGAWTYAHLCSPYYGYFSTLLLGGAAAALVGFARREPWFAASWSRLKTRRMPAALALLGALAVLAPYYAHYQQVSKAFGTRSMKEMLTLSPTVEAWFTASPTSVFYRGQQFLNAEQPGPELSLFTGYASWLLPVALVALLWSRRRANATTALALGLVGALGLLGLLLTRWPGLPTTLYLETARVLEGIRAFRATGRVIYLGLPLAAVAWGFALHDRRLLAAPEAARRAWRWAAWLPALLALESVGGPMYSYAKSESRDRTRAVAESLRAAGLRDVAAFAPGAINQPAWMLDLDGVAGAWAVGLPTLNGYSGKTPRSHQEFFNHVEADEARRLADRVGVAPGRLTLATAFPEWFNTKYRIVAFPMASPFIQVAPGAEPALAAPAGSTATFPVRVINTFARDVPCEALGLHLSYKLYDAAGREVLDPASPRTTLPRLAGGAREMIALHLALPRQPGTYRARVSFVHEGVAWWTDLPGGHGYDLTITVTP